MFEYVSVCGGAGRGCHIPGAVGKYRVCPALFSSKISGGFRKCLVIFSSFQGKTLGGIVKK